MNKVTDYAVIRSLFDYGPYETNPYADQLEREFYRAGLGHLYAAIIENADISEHPQMQELQDKLDETKEELADALQEIRTLNAEIEALQEIIDEAKATVQDRSLDDDEVRRVLIKFL